MTVASTSWPPASPVFQTGGSRAGWTGAYRGPQARAVLTVLVGADDHGRALGPWSHLCVSDSRDAVLRPLVQCLQQDLSGGRGDAVHLLGLRVLRAQRSVADAIAHQGPVVCFRRWRAPTYQNGRGACADTLNILRGGRRFYWRGKNVGVGKGAGWAGRGRGNKRWERENKKEDDNKQNRTKAKRSRTQKRRVSTKGEMGGWGWGWEGWPRTLHSLT